MTCRKAQTGKLDRNWGPCNLKGGIGMKQKPFIIYELDFSAAEAKLLQT